MASGALGGISSMFKSAITTSYASSLSDLGLGNLGISNSSKKNYLIPSNITSKININNKSFNNQNIWFNSVGFTNPKLGFISRGLSNNNYAIIQRKLGQVNQSEDLDIKTYNYEYTSDIRDAMLKINPTKSNQYWEFHNVFPVGHNHPEEYPVTYENPFQPNADILINFNNYRFTFKDPIPVLDGYFNKDNQVVPNIYKVPVSPALFNPLFMVQNIGITPNTPLLNTAKTNNGKDGGIIDVSDCRISTLVNESKFEKSILGLATYRYVDFMYCKDLGKVANNHLITLRKFAHPIGDNIFEFYEKSTGDVGRLVTWFGTEDNKLEDILSFSYQASWKELNAKIEEIESKEDSGNRGPLGMILNSANPQYNKVQAQGHAGHQNIFGFFGINSNWSDDNREILRMYDKNKVYTPKNTIQDTVTYEGKLTFTHEFTLNFCYKLRAYDNINPRSAFLDLIGNILNVTYRRGKFWGGDRRWIGPPQNVSGWQRANSIINNTWDKAGSVISAIMQGKINLGNIVGMMGNAIKGIFNGVQGVMDALKEKGISGVSNDLLNAFKGSGLGGAALGELKNKLGRPAMYAMDSLLKGDNVGLWHVTIGNPKNPIAVMGNLILTNAQFQTSGPLGLDDFPTEIKVTCTLKHARSRDAVEIGRMFTKGTNGIYYTYLGKGRPGNTGMTIKEEPFDAIVGECDDKKLHTVKEQDAGTFDNINNKDGHHHKDNRKVDKGFAKNVEHYNQRSLYDVVMVEDELA